MFIHCFSTYFCMVYSIQRWCWKFWLHTFCNSLFLLLFWLLFLLFVRYDIREGQIVALQELGFSWTSIAALFGMSTRTLYNLRQRLGLLSRHPFSSLSNEELDSLILQVLSSTPNVGQTYIQGSLQSRGLRIQRRRIRERLRIIDPIGRAIRRRQTIRRRIYNISSPNQLWWVYFTNAALLVQYTSWHLCSLTYTIWPKYIKSTVNES